MSAYIYVIGRWKGPVKVGVSRDPVRRLSQLQPGCPFKLELLHKAQARDFRHALMQEQSFHEVHSDYRLIGEWFKLDAYGAIEGIECGFETDLVFEEKYGRRL